MTRLPASDASALPASPCVRSCCLDQDDVCLGCGRQLEEILQWHRADAGERLGILALARERLESKRRRRES